VGHSPFFLFFFFSPPFLVKLSFALEMYLICPLSFFPNRDESKKATLLAPSFEELTGAYFPFSPHSGAEEKLILFFFFLFFPLASLARD